MSNGQNSWRNYCEWLIIIDLGSCYGARLDALFLPFILSGCSHEEIEEQYTSEEEGD